MRAPGGEGGGRGTPVSFSIISLPSPPLSTHTVPGGQDQGRVATVVGLVQRGALGRSERRGRGERGGGGGRGGEGAREVCGVNLPP